MPGEPLRVKLTQRTVEALKPEAEVYYAWDSELKGFGVRVMPSGVRAWVVKYRVRGRAAQAWQTIAKVHLMKAEAARSEALAILAEAAAGRDPLKPKASTLTVKDLVDKFRKEYMSRQLSPRTKMFYDGQFDSYILPAIGRIPVLEVEREDIAGILLPLKPVLANRVRALLSKLFREAEDWGFRVQNTNPVRSIRPNEEQPKERFLSSEEISRLTAALDQMEVEARSRGLGERQPSIEAIRLLMFTGCRHREILHLRWDQVDLERGEFRFGFEHKTGRKNGQKTLPILAPAREILDRLPRRLGSPFLFPGKIHGKPLHDIGKMFQKACERAELVNIEGKDNPRVHDLRHSFASVALEAGVPLEVIGHLLGHSRVETTSRYAHLSVDLKRRAAEQAVGLLLEKMHPKQA